MLDTLKSLLEDQIKDLYSAENQLLKALPKMAKAASSQALREAFTGHLEETKGHVERIQAIAEMMDIKLGGKKCKAMEGLIAEGAEVLEEEGEDAVIDAALIGAAQRVEHYEMAAYTCAAAIAQQLDETEVVAQLEATLQEEEAADEKLGSIAEGEVLPEASTLGEEEAPEKQKAQGRSGNSSVSSNGKSSVAGPSVTVKHLSGRAAAKARKG